MKILQVNCVYGKGSTGKIVADIHHELLKQGIESVVCYGRGQKVNEPNVYKTCGELYSKLNNLWSRITGLMYGGCFLSTRKLISVIRAEKPSVVHLHCINGYFVNIYRLINWLKKQNIRTVLTLHAEFMYTANCGYALECDRWKNGCGYCPRWREETKSWFIDRTAYSWKKMKEAFEGFDNLEVVSVSPWLMKRAQQSPILGGKKHAVVFNGLDTEVFHAYDTEDLRRQHGLNDEKVVFHATPFFSDDPDHIKGGYYVIQLAERMKGEKVKFFVAGSYAPNIKAPANMVLLGQISDQKELARYYSMADVTLLTSKKETFSMIVAESLCCGTPVVGFRAGGPESIAIDNFCEFVDYGEQGDLHRRLIDGLFNETKKPFTNRPQLYYSKHIMVNNYCNVYRGKHEK